MAQETELAEFTETSVMAGDVRDYLLNHPDFLDDNDDILAELVPPGLRRADGVQDFQRYMLARLQDNFSAIKGEHDDLMQLMQEHLQRQNRINSAALSLFDAPDFETTVRFLANDLRGLLDLEAVGLFMESSDALCCGDYCGLRVVADGFVAKWLAGRDVVLEEQTNAAPELFGTLAAPLVRSQALIRLEIRDNLPLGLLALGHRETMYFATGLATEQMEFLGAIAERCLGKWV